MRVYARFNEADVLAVLVPNDEALAAYSNENPDLSNDTDAVRALLEYHIANGTHPSATFGLQPLFVPTLLTDPNYTNVTGGQVVELAALNNRSTIVTGVRATSQLVEAVSAISSSSLPITLKTRYRTFSISAV